MKYIFSFMASLLLLAGCSGDFLDKILSIDQRPVQRKLDTRILQSTHVLHRRRVGVISGHWVLPGASTGRIL